MIMNSLNILQFAELMLGHVCSPKSKCLDPGNKCIHGPNIAQILATSLGEAEMAMTKDGSEA